MTRVHVLDISKRGVGPATLDNVLVDYVVEGEPGMKYDMLRAFLREHTDLVVPDTP